MKSIRSLVVVFGLLAFLGHSSRAELKTGSVFHPFSLRSTKNQRITVTTENGRLTVICESAGAEGKAVTKTHPKAVLLDFWSTSCIPCRNAIPHLNALYEKYGPGKAGSNNDLEIIGISLNKKGMTVVKPFVEIVQMNYIVLADSPEEASDAGILPRTEELDKAYGVARLPGVYLVDAKGMIRHVHLGFNPDHLTELEDEIRNLLAENIPS